MSSSINSVLNPAGNAAAQNAVGVFARRTQRRKPVIGMLNNSKPNASIFLETLEAELKTSGYDTLNVTKPRSAGPYPDIDRFASCCDYVVNAVAD